MTREDIYTCIFGGGAVRGFAYVGAVRALNEMKIKYDTLVGSSVGAILATLVAVGYSYEEIKDIFMKVNFELFRDINFSFGKDFALSKGEIFTQWVRENVEKKIYGKSYKKGKNKPVTFADLEKNLLIYTTDLLTFRCNEFSKQETPDFEIAEAVRISCSMPGLMTPVEINGKRLVDGDLLKSIPLWKLSKNLKLGRNRILEFRLEGEYEQVDNNAIDFFNAIYSCMTSAATDHIICSYGHRDDYDYIKINTGNVIILDLNMSDSMRNNLIDLGYEQSMKVLTSGLLKKKQKLIRYYDDLSKILISLMDFIKADNISRSRIILGELYIYLADVRDLISVSVLDKIKIFKECFIESSQGRTWLGKPKFKDKKILLKNLTKLIFAVNSRLNSLQLTIDKIKLLTPQ